MENITPYLLIVALYFSLFLIIQAFRIGGIRSSEKKTFYIIGGLWASLVFIGNYGFYKMGIMSFIPWINNGLHTFIWIGMVLTYLYMSTRFTYPIWRQVIYFSIFSFIVKYAEQMLFGIWELDHFFWIFKGNFAYVLGWSIMDGLYPYISNFGLKIMSKYIKGLVLVA